MSINKIQMRYSEVFYAVQLLDLFLNLKLITSKQYNEHMKIVVDSTLQKIQHLEYQADPDYNREY